MTTLAINSLLSSYVGTALFYHGEITQAKGNLQSPTMAIITGSEWSQVMKKGLYFVDKTNPPNMVQKGTQVIISSLKYQICFHNQMNDCGR